MTVDLCVGLGPWTPRLLALRRVVFIEEQAVPEDEEVDDQDGVAVHFVVEDDGPLPQGTARMRDKGHGVAKAERVAVRRDRRSAGVGRALMGALEAEARLRGQSQVLLAAQDSAIAFYERLGYVAEGPEFLDAGIVHRWMRKAL